MSGPPGARPARSGRRSARAAGRAVGVARRSRCAPSTASVTHRCQERHRRTWCSSSPHSPLLDWNVSSILHRVPATFTNAVSDVAAGAGSPLASSPACSSSAIIDEAAQLDRERLVTLPAGSGSGVSKAAGVGRSSGPPRTSPPSPRTSSLRSASAPSGSTYATASTPSSRTSTTTRRSSATSAFSFRLRSAPIRETRTMTLR